MRIGKLNAILKAAHRDEHVARSDHRHRLEDELMASYRANHRREWFFMLKPQTAIGRVALGTVILAALGFGACSMPTETEVPMGKQVSIGFKADGGNEFTWDTSFDLSKDTLEHLKQIPGVDDVNISRSLDNGEGKLEVVLWGDDVAGDEVMRVLQEEMGGAENTFVEIKELSGTVHENWASKLGRELFHIELEGNLSDEEMRAQILAQMAAEGFDTSDVSVTTVDGHRAIFISGSSEADGQESALEDEIVIEFVEKGEAGDQ
ncbi:MAG TPA: hypothetical protein VGB13_09570 [Candidatus Krumholzibacteria bacterium]|jgi:hypothetical protein